MPPQRNAMLDRHFNTTDRKSFRAATRLYAGPGARHDLRTLLPEGPLLLVADVKFMAIDALAGKDIAVAAPVAHEPTFSHVDAIKQQIGKQKFEAVLAVGGGSAIDTAKALHSYLCFGDQPVRDCERPDQAPLLIALPTNAGSGSETSRFYILSDDQHVKRAQRAWSFAPDLAILDPELLMGAGPERLTLGAFDAFVHLWETMICRNERAPFVDMLGLEGMALIAGALGPLESGATPGVEQLMALQRASAYGGMAISNVRTGLIHTLGESLAAHMPLGHAETLFAFFDTVIEHYAPHLKSEIGRIDRRLAADVGANWNFERLCDGWRRLFERFGITRRIDAALNASAIDIDSFLTTVARDTVLPKEHPVSIDGAGIAALAKRGLSRVLLHPNFSETKASA